MLRRLSFSLLLLGTVSNSQTLRPPAVPLITHDPYFSVWSMTDRVNTDPTRHWTGKPQRIISLIRVDGKAYRLTGSEPRDVPLLPQTALRIFATRSVYRFEGVGVVVEMCWLSPLLPNNLDVLEQPVSYVTWSVHSSDGKPHRAEIYFEASDELAVNTPDQTVTFGRLDIGGADTIRIGTQEQPVLKRKGDDVRIDWGYLYVMPVPSTGQAPMLSIRNGGAARRQFVEAGHTQLGDTFEDGHASLTVSFELNEVSAEPAERSVAIAYDDIWSLEYFERRVRPWWRKDGATISEALSNAVAQYQQRSAAAAQFDNDLWSDLKRVGGEKYAGIASLAYRQAFAANKLVVDADGTPLYFPKENFSNGCIGTVDVIYPGAPILLLFAPKLLEAQLRPLFDYAEMPRWRFPFAPHDLGTYPKANGQVYGGGEKTEEDQMPVEESGNLLILADALEQAEGNTHFAERYRPLLDKWATYLKEKGLDPENQLSTDDFAGHLAHNANLSIKAILGIAAYGQLCERLGDHANAAEYRQLAKSYAAQWMKRADDGDHYRLAFDSPGSWSQKYNLVWDKLLHLDIFPPQVAQKELAFYKTHQLAYGLPLDNRRDYTKLDWIFWTSTLADSRSDFESLTDPVWKFLNETPSRVPMTDWYSAATAKQEGFQARSVVGGVFVKMLTDPEAVKRWRTLQ